MSSSCLIESQIVLENEFLIVCYSGINFIIQTIANNFQTNSSIQLISATDCSKQYTKRRSEIKAYPYAMVQSFYDHYYFIIYTSCKVTILKNVFPYSIIFVFSGNTFPCNTRMSKEKIYLKFTSDAFVFSKSSSVDTSDGIERSAIGC